MSFFEWVHEMACEFGCGINVVIDTYLTCKRLYNLTPEQAMSFTYDKLSK